MLPYCAEFHLLYEVKIMASGNDVMMSKPLWKNQCAREHGALKEDSGMIMCLIIRNLI